MKSSRSRRRRWALGVAVVGALAGAGVVGYLHALRTLVLPWRRVATGAPVRALAFSPSGEVVAVMGQDAVVRVFRASDGQPVTSFVCGREKGVSLAFLPDGEKLVCSAESSVKLWAWREGRCLKTFPEHPHEIGVLAVSPDGQRVAATASDGKVRLWTSDGFLLSRSDDDELESKPKTITSLTFSRDGERIFVGNPSGIAGFTGDLKFRDWWGRGYSLGDESELAGTGVLALARSPTKDAFVVAGLRQAFVRSNDDSSELPLLEPYRIGLCSVAYTADGEAIVGADPFGRVHVWESATGKLVAQSRPRTPAPRELETSVLWPTVVAVSPRGDRIASGDLEGSVSLWWMPGR